MAEETTGLGSAFEDDAATPPEGDTTQGGDGSEAPEALTVAHDGVDLAVPKQFVHEADGKRGVNVGALLKSQMDGQRLITELKQKAAGGQMPAAPETTEGYYEGWDSVDRSDTRLAGMLEEFRAAGVPAKLAQGLAPKLLAKGADWAPPEKSLESRRGEAWAQRGAGADAEHKAIAAWFKRANAKTPFDDTAKAALKNLEATPEGIALLLAMSKGDAPAQAPSVADVPGAGDAKKASDDAEKERVLMAMGDDRMVQGNPRYDPAFRSETLRDFARLFPEGKAAEVGVGGNWHNGGA